MPLFDPNQSLGALAPNEIATYLQDIGDLDGAGSFAPGSVSAQGLGWGTPAYAYTGMVLGFIDADSGSGTTTSPILGISQIQGDGNLIGKRIKISLDKFHVHTYPGRGEHNILCEFAGKNQVSADAEDLRYTLRFKAFDESSPSLSGVPVFLGINVGGNGISFEGRTVNVSSTTDETLLAIMDSPTFKTGLGLLTAAQPALKPFAGLAGAAVNSVLSRSKNKQVHAFNLGLDFSSTSTAARLRLGTYVMVQCGDAADWAWDQFEWNRDSMALLNKATRRPPEFNYMAFGVSAFIS